MDITLEHTEEDVYIIADSLSVLQTLYNVISENQTANALLIKKKYKNGYSE